MSPRRSLAIFLGFCAFSALWSWPLALSPASVTMGLHFDQFPAAWLVHAAPSFVPDGVSELSAWPSGEPDVSAGAACATGAAVALARCTC